MEGGCSAVSVAVSALHRQDNEGRGDEQLLRMSGKLKQLHFDGKISAIIIEINKNILWPVPAITFPVGKCEAFHTRSRLIRTIWYAGTVDGVAVELPCHAGRRTKGYD